LGPPFTGLPRIRAHSIPVFHTTTRRFYCILFRRKTYISGRCGRCCVSWHPSRGWLGSGVWSQSADVVHVSVSIGGW